MYKGGFNTGLDTVNLHRPTAVALKQQQRVSCGGGRGVTGWKHPKPGQQGLTHQLYSTF